jgi:2'-5' RNA ligase
MKRTFIAIKIASGESMKEIYNHFREDLSREKIKWVNPDSMHITLCFLGDTNEEKIQRLRDEIEKTVSLFPPLKLDFQGCGVFKNLRDPRVIWFGLEENELLKDLKNSLDSTIEPFGFMPDKRDFMPHLTMARIKWIRDISVLEDLINAYKDEPLQVSDIGEVIYYESILKPDGPEYIPLLNATLDGLALKM